MDPEGSARAASFVPALGDTGVLATGPCPRRVPESKTGSIDRGAQRQRPGLTQGINEAPQHPPQSQSVWRLW